MPTRLRLVATTGTGGANVYSLAGGAGATPARWMGGAAPDDAIAYAPAWTVPTGPVAPAWAARQLGLCGADNWETRVLLAIGMHESGFRRGAVNHVTGDYGFYQINHATAPELGTTTSRLLSSDRVNHVAALRLLRANVRASGHNAIPMFAAWWTGHVGAGSAPPWYLDVPDEAVITWMAGAYNANSPTPAWETAAPDWHGGLTGGQLAIAALGVLGSAGILGGGLWLASRRRAA